MMIARKRVRLLPVQQLFVRHFVNHSSLRHSSSDHSSPDLPSTSAGPSRKRRRDIGYLADVEVDPRETRVERVAHPVTPEDIPEPAQEGAVETIEDVQREQGHWIVGVESAVTALTERVAELERDNQWLKGTASVESQRVDRLQRDMKMPNTRSRTFMTHEEVERMAARRVAEETEAREVARNLETLNENEEEQEGDDGGNENGGNENGGNGKDGNHGMNYGGTKGVVGLTRWFEKMETVFNISNCPSKYKVKYATCILQNSALTWWNSHKRTIGVDVPYAMKWAGLMKLMTEVYCPRNEQPPFKRQNSTGQNVAKAYTTGSNGRKGEPQLEIHRLLFVMCGRSGHFRKDCPKLRNQNCGNQTRNKTGNKIGGNEVTAKAYVIGGGGTNPDSNVATGTFLLNNCYASILFDSGADRSFVSTIFSALIDVAPFTLDTSYAVELTEGRISETNIILRGCTLGLLGHSFNIDLMPVELGSFDI
nr:hypothetical protein [Tanacetum cinerariifolium]